MYIAILLLSPLAKVQADIVTQRGAAVDAGDIKAAVAVVFFSPWLDVAPPGELRGQCQDKIMQQGQGSIPQRSFDGEMQQTKALDIARRYTRCTKFRGGKYHLDIGP